MEILYCNFLCNALQKEQIINAMQPIKYGLNKDQSGGR